MKQLDDIRDPQKKIKPKIMRGAAAASFFSSITAKAKVGLMLLPNRWSSPKLKQLALPLFIIFTVVISMFIARLTQNQKPQQNSQEAKERQFLLDTVITNDTKVVADYTFNLQMIIDGQRQAIPANFGKVEAGQLILSADNQNGTIHVKSPNTKKYKLKDFFTIWGSQFNKNCLLNHCDSNSPVSMMVNGQPNNKYADYEPKQGDQIQLVYGTAPEK